MRTLDISDGFETGDSPTAELTHIKLGDDGLAITPSAVTGLVIENSGGAFIGFQTPANDFRGLYFNEGANSDRAEFKYRWTGSASTSSYVWSASSNTVLMELFGDGNMNLTGKIRTGSGTEGSPAQSYISDSNSGGFAIGSDDIGWSTGGGQRLRLDDGGNVVIGGGSTVTTRVNGHMWIPSSTGAPTGVPDKIATHTGRFPMVYDSVNKTIGVYDGGWIFTAALT